MIRVLIADDHPVVRTGIKHSLMENPGITVVHEAGTARELFDYLSHSSCDVVVMDIVLPDQNGLEVLRLLKQSHPQLPVLILTLFPEDLYAVHCLRAGAAGFLNISNNPSQFAEAIMKAHRGGRYLSPELAESLVFEKHDAPFASPHKALTGREFQVFCQIATGRAQKAIAGELGLSAKTISTHRVRLLRKMRMNNNADIVRYALAHQLVA